MKIIKATTNDIPLIQSMANVVFRKTYKEIISSEQMEFMIEWMYSVESLNEQINGEEKEFFIAKDDNGEGLGYVSVEREKTLADGRPLFHLQKIYVMPNAQGTGIGKQLFTFLMNHLRKISPDGCRVELNVNRENKAVGFYEAMGMRRDREGDFPIGNGFYMNDYIYAIDL